jgi:hypothetical protein
MSVSFLRNRKTDTHNNTFLFPTWAEFSIRTSRGILVTCKVVATRQRKSTHVLLFLVFQGKINFFDILR